jgi:hypothetical protein
MKKGVNMKFCVLKLIVLIAICSGIALAQQPINLVNVGGTALGAVSNYGTSPGAVSVIGVNAFVTNTVTVSGSGVFQVGPTGSANTASNTFFTNLSDGTHALSAAMSAWGTAPTGTFVMGVNANIMGPIDGSGYVNIDCKTGCGTTTTISLVPQTTGGLSAKHFVAAASDNATNLKASAGQVYSIDVYNNAAYPVFLKIYNSASSPTGCGATGLFKVVGVQAGTQHILQTEEGWALGTGIGYCLTKGITDADDTAVLISDATVDLGYK